MDASTRLVDARRNGGEHLPPTVASPAQEWRLPAGSTIAQWCKLALDRFALARSAHGTVPVFYEVRPTELTLRSRRLEPASLQGAQTPAWRTWRIGIEPAQTERTPAGADGTATAAFRVRHACVVTVAQGTGGPLLIDLVAAGTTALIGREDHVGRVLEGWIVESLAGRFSGPVDVVLVGPPIGRVERATMLTRVASVEDLFDLDPMRTVLAHRQGPNDRPLLVIVHRDAVHDEEELAHFARLVEANNDLALVVVGPNAPARVVIIAGDEQVSKRGL